MARELNTAEEIAEVTGTHPDVVVAELNRIHAGYCDILDSCERQSAPIEDPIDNFERGFQKLVEPIGS